MIYDLMLELPIFQGLSHDQLTEIIEKVPFSFHKFRSEEILSMTGDECDKVMFLLSGRVQTVSEVLLDIHLIQDFEAPQTLPFYNLFGRNTLTQSNIYADGSVGVMTLDKDNFLKMIENNRLMLINVLNILSAHAQRQQLAMNFMCLSKQELRLGAWLLATTHPNAKNVVIKAAHENWHKILGFTGNDFEIAIQKLKAIECIEFDDDRLKLTDRYNLQAYVCKNFQQE